MERIAEWISTNGLALYGAIVGTVALTVTFFSHRHNVKKERIKLEISFCPHPKQISNLALLNSDEAKKPGHGPTIVEVFAVTVRNHSGVPAPLEDVGVVTDGGTVVLRWFPSTTLGLPCSAKRQRCNSKHWLPAPLGHFPFTCAEKNLCTSCGRHMLSIKLVGAGASVPNYVFKPTAEDMLRSSGPLPRSGGLTRR